MVRIAINKAYSIILIAGAVLNAATILATLPSSSRYPPRAIAFSNRRRGPADTPDLATRHTDGGDPFRGTPRGFAPASDDIKRRGTFKSSDTTSSKGTTLQTRKVDNAKHKFYTRGFTTREPDSLYRDTSRARVPSRAMTRTMPLRRLSDKEEKTTNKKGPIKAEETLLEVEEGGRRGVFARGNVQPVNGPPQKNAEVPNKKTVTFNDKVTRINYTPYSSSASFGSSGSSVSSGSDSGDEFYSLPFRSTKNFED
ncbi:hypothetical protein AMATHDRAFT_9459 [Amanita thiersii Skay4041]|uniref:Uncharacterized protein n=1 Tax=Amanita thiersii Skay4041 TaxID=703135 RepID=A0A2A9N6K4_9AGAR|nr:hypothetical protein AMATHDRAFT_9459 [Amanita thiersii Skay4041]